MIRKHLVRAVSALAIGVGLLAGPGTVAHAADPVTVGISDVKANAATVTGVLTLRSKSAAQVDRATLKARIDNQDATVAIQQAPTLERRAMLVIDTSGSMGAAGMATVRAATAQYLRDAPADVQVGVATFADTAGVDLPPTLDRAAVQRVVDGLASRGDTSLYAGVQNAIASLGTVGDRSIVLLSDGADTIAADKAAARSAVTAALTAAGVRTDVVQFKTTDPDAVTALHGFAAANGGAVVAAGDTAAVTAAFQASAKALDSQVQFTVTAPTPLTGMHTLHLSGVAGGTTFAFDRAVDAQGVAAAQGAAPGGTPPSDQAAQLSAPGVPGTGSQPWLFWVAALLVSVAVFALAATSLTPSLQTHREKRVAAIESYVVNQHLPSATRARGEPTEIGERVVAWGERVMSRRESTKGTMALMEQADLPFRAGEWFVVHVVAGIAGGVLGFVVARQAGLVGLTLALAIGATLGAVVPTVVLRFLATRRARAFERILPDVLMLVATSLRSGFGLAQALDAVARDAAEPAAKEFSRALAETRIGTDITDALDHLAARMDSTAMRWTVMAMRIQRDVGGNLAETLMTTARTLRERESLRRQVSTLSAEGRLSAYILIALPIGVLFYMLLVNRDYISLLWTTLLGLLMLGGAAVMLVIGVFWMRRVVRIEV